LDVDGLQAQRAGQRPRVCRDLGPTVVAQEIQTVARRDSLHIPDPPFHRFDEHLCTGSPGSPLSMETVSSPVLCQQWLRLTALTIALVR
jgi:hypothetical protein